MRTRKIVKTPIASNQSKAQSEIAFKKNSEGVKLDSLNIDKNLQNLSLNNLENNDLSLRNISEESEESTLTNFQNSSCYQELLQDTAENIFNSSINPFGRKIANINKSKSLSLNSLESLSEIREILMKKYSKKILQWITIMLR